MAADIDLGPLLGDVLTWELELESCSREQILYFVTSVLG
jgi:hypothetical protein